MPKYRFSAPTYWWLKQWNTNPKILRKNRENPTFFSNNRSFCLLLSENAFFLFSPHQNRVAAKNGPYPERKEKMMCWPARSRQKRIRISEIKRRYPQILPINRSEKVKDRWLDGFSICVIDSKMLWDAAGWERQGTVLPLRFYFGALRQWGKMPAPNPIFA